MWPPLCTYWPAAKENAICEYRAPWAKKIDAHSACKSLKLVYISVTSHVCGLTLHLLTKAVDGQSLAPPNVLAEPPPPFDPPVLVLLSSLLAHNAEDVKLPLGRVRNAIYSILKPGGQRGAVKRASVVVQGIVHQPSFGMVPAHFSHAHMLCN